LSSLGSWSLLEIVAEKENGSGVEARRTHHVLLSFMVLVAI